KRSEEWLRQEGDREQLTCSCASAWLPAANRHGHRIWFQSFPGADLADITSDSRPNASARAIAPTSRNSCWLFTTGTFRTWLESNVGNAAGNFWAGVRHAGGGRIMSKAITLLSCSPAL